MKMSRIIAVAVLILAACLPATAKWHRTIAFTFDDLPVSSSQDSIEARQQIMAGLIAKIANAKAPAIGFVNETQLYDDGQLDAAEVALLRNWLDAGFELGNHTFSHLSINDGLDAFEADILKGEAVTRPMLAERGLTEQYFRHPYLDTGKTMDIKHDLDRFLADHGYKTAPVTMDISDWIFADALEKAMADDDKYLIDRVASAYVPYVERKMKYWERQSVKVFGREIPQVMLMHANYLNSQCFGLVAAMLKKRGYRFITLERALRDKAYRQPDRYLGGDGISWLSRWALAKGDKYVLDNEPETPKFVLRAAGVTSE